MSNYLIKAKDKKTGETFEFVALDDYFGKHRYGYKLKDIKSLDVLTEEEFYKYYQILK